MDSGVTLTGAYYEQALARGQVETVREAHKTVHFFNGGVCNEMRYHVRPGDTLPSCRIVTRGMTNYAQEYTPPRCRYCDSALEGLPGALVPPEHRCPQCGSDVWEGRYFETAIDCFSPSSVAQEAPRVRESSGWFGRFLGKLIVWGGVFFLAHVLGFDKWLLEFARALGYGFGWR